MTADLRARLDRIKAECVNALGGKAYAAKVMSGQSQLPHGFSPAAAQALLVAIAGLEEMSHTVPGCGCTCCYSLQRIADAWPVPGGEGRG